MQRYFALIRNLKVSKLHCGGPNAWRKIIGFPHAEFQLMSCNLSSQLSVVMVVPCYSENFRMALGRLRAQSVSHLLEIIIVTPSMEKLKLAAREIECFADCKVLEVPTSEGQAKAAGVEAASSPLVAFVEDHSYPDAAWADALINAHRSGDFVAVGPVMLNANPDSALSWGCFLVYYSPWLAARPQQEVKHLPGNQSCYRRDILLKYGPRLSDMLQTESVLHWDLVAKGHRLHLEHSARVYHLNSSLLGPILHETYLASRMFAANRAQNWGLFRKTLYALGSPLLPGIRMGRILRDALRVGLQPCLILKALGAMMLNLCAGSAGEMVGYALGAGKSDERLRKFNEKRHLNYTAGDLEAVARL